MSVPVAIIGAGPYGLSLSAHLSARGVEHRIVGRTMESWDEHMPGGMFLKSEGCASNIDAPQRGWSLARFCERAGVPYADARLPVPIETFRAYGRAFQRELVPHLENDRVTRLARNGDGFTLELDRGTRMVARRVVAAVGITAFAYVPPALRGLPAGAVSHTSEHADFARFRGRRVAVVGAGQSALETAALLREGGAHPELIARAGTLNWNPDPAVSGYDEAARRWWQLPPTPLGAGWRLWTYWKSMPAYPALPDRFRVRHVRRTLGPAGAWWLRPRVTGAVPLHLAQHLVEARADDGAVVLRLSEGRETRELRIDHVIAGTGYRVDVGRLGFLAPELAGAVATLDGAPVLSRRFESSVPGLYFAGLAAATTFGPAMRFVCGTSFAGPTVARHLARGATPPGQ
jgi:cation diffusion facilitator CzcD-associated flavoprotein CzcO